MLTVKKLIEWQKAITGVQHCLYALERTLEDLSLSDEGSKDENLCRLDIEDLVKGELQRKMEYLSNLEL